MKKSLEAIKAVTTALWYQVNAKYGDHSYTLGVNGLDEVVLCKGYVEEIAKGDSAIQSVLTDLLTA